MTVIPDAAKKVPLMFRAQTSGRCQLQRLVKGQEPDAVLWADEWTDKTYPEAPVFDAEVQTRSYTLSWRFVTNSGQDDGVIRPVIGAKGYPFYPGSSMKGIFRRACTAEQAARYCGKPLSGGDYEPGLLRFHGGYPIDTSWTEHLVDIVHPQQDWQVKNDNKNAGAFVQISLYRPTLQFGISSTIPLEPQEWETIWSIWEKAFSTGIGCRVCAGYGQPENQAGDLLYKCRLKGQGQAAKLLDGTGEFRPNVFRAAIRGHALRIFGGLTDERTADRLIDQLFGSAMDKGTVGLLSLNFRPLKLEIATFGKGSYSQPTYEVEGELIWHLTQKLNPDKREALTKLIAALTRFAMLLGGFGKSWRRADHRLFLPDYYDEDYKPLIGCHWQWAGERSLAIDVKVRKLDKVGEFINEVRQAAQIWMQVQGVAPTSDRRAPWRESWHPDNVQVWGRVAEEAEDSEAIHWLHGPYQDAVPSARISEGSIYDTHITGKVGQIGRIWHRMYPVVRLKPPENPGSKPQPVLTRKYLELLTFFPDDSLESKEFLQYLSAQADRARGFQKLWS
ncbi:RAMP superfamily protein [Kovacikia minuta CCNUW1]|uniref:RAMP superfamily protein n=1 Tax=Kovacikia minuta TaxID=2931930 RepID=UPI001CC93EEB|nr:RAMP superfamily protein [Kovacikia minuta]UBF24362.1 RAMP superfamily protein [Kovacikia minuta CCNUW1]